MDDSYTPRSRRSDDLDDPVRRRRRRREADEDLGDEEPRPPRRKRKSASSGLGMSTRTKVILWSVGIGLVLGGLGIWYTVRTIRRSPFRKHMHEYLATAEGGPGMAGPPAVGKMVVVDVKDKDVDSLHFDLPDDLRAGTPEEVVTVVRLDWNKNKVGAYQGGGSAYQWFCDVTLFDLASRRVLHSQRFAGAPPPPNFYGKRGESRTGDKPSDAIISYLKGLPRRGPSEQRAGGAPAGGNPPPAGNPVPGGTPAAVGNPPPRAPVEVDPQLLLPRKKVILAAMQEFDVVNGPWPFSKGTLGDPAHTLIKLNRVRAPRGLSMRPATGTGARARYALGGRASVFRATVGLADDGEACKGNVTFEVLGDGKSLWRSRPVHDRGDVQKCEVSVRGVKVLELRTSVDGPDAGANAVWISVHVQK